jgi:hypothetical protein
MLLRPLADDGRTGINGAAIEQDIFGRSTSLYLQQAFFSGHYGVFERIATWVHLSWFYVLPLVTVLVVLRYREEFLSYLSWHSCALYLALFAFFIAPMQPPWMADGSVTRILTLRVDGFVEIDTNPMAAMPSLHVGLPLVLAVWAKSRGHRLLARVLFLYSAAIGLSVVFLGEHYLLDVAGAGVLALAVASVQKVFVVQRIPRFRSFPAIGAAQSGQNLIEFALLAPLLIGLIAGIVVFGIALNTRSSLQQAVREAARQRAVGVAETDALNIGAGNAPDVLAAGDLRFCYPPDADGTRGQTGDPVKAYIFKDGAVGYPYTIVSSTGILKAANVGNLTVRMKPSATTRLEKTAGAPAALPTCPAGS